MNKKKIIKDIISYIFSFFIAISLTVFMICIMLLGGLFNKETFLSGFSASTFYEERLESLDNNLSARLKTAGLPSSCKENVFKSGIVTVDINKALRQVTNNEEVDIDYHKPGNVLRSNIKIHLNRQGIPVDSNINESIELLVEETENDYRDQLSFGFVKQFYGFFDKYYSTVKMIRNISLAVLLVSAIAMLLIRTRVYRGVRFIQYGLFAGSVLSFLLAWLMRHDIAKLIPKEQGAYRELVSSFVARSFNQGKYMFIAGILLVVIFNVINRYLKKQVI